MNNNNNNNNNDNDNDNSIIKHDGNKTLILME